MPLAEGVGHAVVHEGELVGEQPEDADVMGRAGRAPLEPDDVLQVDHALDEAAGYLEAGGRRGPEVVVVHDADVGVVVDVLGEDVDVILRRARVVREAELQEVDAGVGGVLGAAGGLADVEVEYAYHGGDLAAGLVHERIDEGEELVVLQVVALAVAARDHQDAGVAGDALVEQPPDVLALPVQPEAEVIVGERG